MAEYESVGGRGARLLGDGWDGGGEGGILGSRGGGCDIAFYERVEIDAFTG